MVVRPYFTSDKAVLPFDKVIELETIDAWTFRSIVKAYSPTGGENGTYGGHVFAQAAWAAAQTVAEGLLIHVCFPNITFTTNADYLARTSQVGLSSAASRANTTSTKSIR
jgi:hypothetical protein